MVVPVLVHPHVQIVPVFIILIWRVLPVFFLCCLKSLVVSGLKFCDFGLTAFCPGRKSIPVMDHILQQGTHLPVPGAVWLVIHTVFKIAQDMGKAFLVVCAIAVKSSVVVMHQDALNSSAGVPFTPSCPFFSRTKYREAPSGAAHINTYPLLPFILALVQSVCITGLSSMSANMPLRSCSVFSANSLQRLFIMPLDMLSLPPVKSDRKFLLLSMDMQQSLFSRNRKALMLPS